MKSESSGQDDKCFRQALIFFNELKAPAASFTNHYNGDLEKCFVLVESVVDSKTFRGRTETSKDVYDAYERKPYAVFRWVSDPAKKYWEVPPTYCSVWTRPGVEKSCHSEHEWDELARPYTGGGFQ